MSEFKIEKGVSIPDVEPKYPFSEMDIGDSFEFPKNLISKVRSAAYSFSSSRQTKFVVKKTINEAARCWRIA